MTGFCCCGVPRPPRTVTPSTPSPRNQTPKPSGALPPLPPPARLPVAGPLTSNPVIAIPLAVDAYPDSSSKSGTSLQLATSSVIVPIGPADLSDLVVEDSEDDLPGRSTEPSKSTSTLQLVRENIRRHLSQDSLPKKKSRSAVGSSQEEIQRRAELKRLMHKRIQEELRIEQSHERSRSEVSSVLPPPRSSSPDYLPGGGPRDALEFSVAQEEEGEAHSDTTSSSIAKSSADVSAPGKAAPLSDKENSCPRVNSLKYPTIAVIQKPVRERSSLPEMPASPVLAPQRYSNTIDTSSLGSWRLSYSATQLEDFLGFIDQDGSSQDAESSLKAAASRAVTSRSVPLLRRSKSETRPRSSSARTPGNATPCVLDQSPMGIWLRSQGLGSCSPSLSLGRSSDRDGDPEISVEQAKVVMLKRCSSIPNHPGGDISLQRPEIVHLHDMDIHRQLATQTLNTPEESPANTESEQNTVRRQPNGQAGLISNPSSAYPSAGHSADPSAGTSSSHLPSGVMGPHNLLSATPLRWLLPSNPFGESHSNMATGGSSLDSPTDGGTATQTELISSGVASDTINKRQSVPKLNIMERSFARFHLGHGAPSNISKRFDKPTDSMKLRAEPSKRSLLARLHLSLPRRVKLTPASFDGQVDGEQNTPLPSTSRPVDSQRHKKSALSDVGPQTLHQSSEFPFSDCDDSTVELWQSAVREEIWRRHTGTKKRHSDYRPFDVPPKTYYPYPYPGARPGGQDQSSSPVSISTELSAKTLESNPEPSDNVLNVAGVRRSSLESPGPEIQRPRKFPEAWARFPSYNRAERNEDHENTDQARTERIASHKPPNQEITQTAISGAISNRQHNGVMGHRQKNSMSSKFGKALKSGLDKLVHSRRSSDVSCGDSHLDQARATLEYPELALHPTEAGYRELEALGREIRRLKRLVSNEVEDGPRPWVTLPVGSDVELDGSNAGSHRNLTMPGTFPRSRGGDSSATTDKFATPLSSPSLNDASFHSFPRSYSPESSRQSSIPISNKAVVPEIKITDLSSVKSDTTLVLRTHQVRFSDENGQCQSDSATSGSSKYNTWSGPNDSQTIDDANESDDSDQVFPTNNKRGSHLENSLSIQEIAAGNV
ncbi:hypothetical protein GE21DRAFT_1253441 [Neurospora crassa]|uniref:Uncharacterized protein B19C19.150 n=1 Tax=Neurospora crassa TaxID=5141 RepID=Q8X059_NEUCS|nr:hypothetical protein GE21DRAFT_1253441 [Neurospora crassa]CAD21152.1 conserved hypothetical protein [Neurospora crassa]